MAIQSASAALTTTVEMVTITGFIFYQQGDIDNQTGVIKAQGSSKWSSVAGSTWSTFKNYQQTFQNIIWTAPVVDLGAVGYFNLAITSDFDGSLNYLVHTSDTGDFTGEETEYYIAEGNLNVDAFYGRYVYVTAFVNGPELRRLTVTGSNTSISFNVNNLDSSTCSGSISAREIPMTQSVSRITDIKIEPKAATPYAVNLYVSDTATSVILIPVVVSKSSTPTFALYGIDNDPRDGIVDITISALPRQVMYGGNLLVLS